MHYTSLGSAGRLPEMPGAARTPGGATAARDRSSSPPPRGWYPAANRCHSCAACCSSASFSCHCSACSWRSRRHCQRQTRYTKAVVHIHTCKRRCRAASLQLPPIGCMGPDASRLTLSSGAGLTSRATPALLVQLAEHPVLLNHARSQLSPSMPPARARQRWRPTHREPPRVASLLRLLATAIPRTALAVVAAAAAAAAAGTTAAATAALTAGAAAATTRA